MAKINSINNKTGSMTIDPATAAADSFYQFDINAVNKYRVGVDATDDTYKISQGNALGTNDFMVITTTGNTTMPLQPAFLAVLNTTVSDQTGDATAYTIAFDTEIFDQNSDFSSTTFTAPVTGKYFLESSVLGGGLAAGNTLGTLIIHTSNRDYVFTANPATVRDVNNQYSWYNHVLADMDSADVATVVLTVSGGTKIVDVIGTGSTTPACWFCGNLEV